MALSTLDKFKAAKWFIVEAWKKPRNPAVTDVIVLVDTVTSVDDWFDDAPTGGGGTRSQQLVSEMPVAFVNATNASEKTMIVAATALARAGAL